MVKGSMLIWTEKQQKVANIEIKKQMAGSSALKII